jgi:dipeptidyl aminopeptidase/acylaminoacyl peptidase
VVARRGFDPGDVLSIEWCSDVALSPDGELISWTRTVPDETADAPSRSIWLAHVDGREPPRPFTPGPRDTLARFSPDGRHLAYLSAEAGPPTLRLARLDGGVPRTVEAGGPVSWMEWSPSGDRIAIVVTVGAPTPDESPTAKNAAQPVRGTNNRLDGIGRLVGRAQVAVVEVATGECRTLTRGDFDATSPSWSPDGGWLTYLSDRSRRRFDSVGFANVWKIPSRGGSPTRLSPRLSDPSHPTFSPDGRTVAVVAVEGAADRAGASRRILLLSATSTGTGAARRALSAIDDTVAVVPPARPYAWLSRNEIAVAVARRGTVAIIRGRVGSHTTRDLFAPPGKVTSFAVSGLSGSRRLAATWHAVDRFADVVTRALDGTGVPREVSRGTERLKRTVQLVGLRSHSARSDDGRLIEYFAMMPVGWRRGDAAPPCIVDVHGGPTDNHPQSSIGYFYQALCAAGYSVVLPNPRGSTGYGEEFSRLVVGDWGGGDFLDVLACADDAVRRGIASERRMFIAGYSYGGFMTSWALGHSDRFRAAVIGAPVVDLVSMFGAGDVGPYIGEVAGGDPWSGATLHERSPLTHLDKASMPSFIHVHDGDLRCPVGQTDELFVGLRFHGVPVEYVRYPGGSHQSIGAQMGPPSQNIDRLERVIDFLARNGGVRRRRSQRRG